MQGTADDCILALAASNSPSNNLQEKRDQEKLQVKNKFLGRTTTSCERVGLERGQCLKLAAQLYSGWGNKKSRKHNAGRSDSVNLDHSMDNMPTNPVILRDPSCAMHDINYGPISGLIPKSRRCIMQSDREIVQSEVADLITCSPVDKDFVSPLSIESLPAQDSEMKIIEGHCLYGGMKEATHESKNPILSECGDISADINARRCRGTLNSAECSFPFNSNGIPVSPVKNKVESSLLENCDDEVGTDDSLEMKFQETFPSTCLVGEVVETYCRKRKKVYDCPMVDSKSFQQDTSLVQENMKESSSDHAVQTFSGGCSKDVNEKNLDGVIENHPLDKAVDGCADVESPGMDNERSLDIDNCKGKPTQGCLNKDMPLENHGDDEGIINDSSKMKFQKTCQDTCLITEVVKTYCRKRKNVSDYPVVDSKSFQEDNSLLQKSMKFSSSENAVQLFSGGCSKDPNGKNLDGVMKDLPLEKVIDGCTEVESLGMGNDRSMDMDNCTGKPTEGCLNKDMPLVQNSNKYFEQCERLKPDHVIDVQSDSRTSHVPKESDEECGNVVSDEYVDKHSVPSLSDMSNSRYATTAVGKYMNSLPERPLIGSCRKKLLVLDINGLLADIVPLPVPHRRTPDAIIPGKAVFKRPFCDDFLQFCFTRFNVGVWSSRTRQNLERILDSLMGDAQKKLFFRWDQYHCTDTGFNTVENRDKPLRVKKLKKLWEKYDKYLPWERGEYNETNTLLIDDSPHKALANPPYTAIFPHSYRYSDEGDNSLGPGGALRLYLEGLANAENVQKYVEENPFGQRPITEKNLSWRFYLKVIEAISSTSRGTSSRYPVAISSTSRGTPNRYSGAISSTSRDTPSRYSGAFSSTSRDTPNRYSGAFSSTSRDTPNRYSGAFSSSSRDSPSRYSGASFHWRAYSGASFHWRAYSGAISSPSRGNPSGYPGAFSFRDTPSRYSGAHSSTFRDTPSRYSGEFSSTSRDTPSRYSGAFSSTSRDTSCRYSGESFHWRAYR